MHAGTCCGCTKQHNGIALFSVPDEQGSTLLKATSPVLTLSLIPCHDKVSCLWVIVSPEPMLSFFTLGRFDSMCSTLSLAKGR